MGRPKKRNSRGTRPSAPPLLLPIPIGPNVPTATAPESQMRPGMPALDSVHARMMIASPKDSGRSYTILRTTEVDAYELAKAEAAGLPPPGLTTPAPTGDSFQGKARKAAKLSIAGPSMESFNDIRTFVGSLTADHAMVALKPPIKTDQKSNRVKKERRNIRVRAFLYAASREDDNDFHLIIGRDPAKAPEMYVTMELSGLPPKSAASHAKLKTARDAFKVFFGQNLPGLTYDFYNPPIPVILEGSLFFDMNHATGSRPGPQSLKSRMPTIWEVHPITRITFEP